MSEDAIIIIPVRKGSKRIKNKNLAIVKNQYLVEHTIKDAINCSFTNEIYITTDYKDFDKLFKKYPINIVKRPSHLSVDTSSSESALIHVLDQRIKDGKKDPKFVVFLQCTSPFREEKDIDKAIETMISQKANSLLSVVEFKRFIWKKKKMKFFHLIMILKKEKENKTSKITFRKMAQFILLKLSF